MDCQLCISKLYFEKHKHCEIYLSFLALELCTQFSSEYIYLACEIVSIIIKNIHIILEKYLFSNEITFW